MGGPENGRGCWAQWGGREGGGFMPPDRARRESEGSGQCSMEGGPSPGESLLWQTKRSQRFVVDGSKGVVRAAAGRIRCGGRFNIQRGVEGVEGRQGAFKPESERHMQRPVRAWTADQTPTTFFCRPGGRAPDKARAREGIAGRAGPGWGRPAGITNGTIFLLRLAR